MQPLQNNDKLAKSIIIKSMIYDNIKNEVKDAMRAKDTVKLNTLRSVLSEFTNELVSSGKTPQDSVTDEIALIVIKRLAKQRKDSIEQFEKGDRQDLADNEKEELKFLKNLI